MSENVNAVCLIHGKKHSEHDCLYCGLCFKPLTVDECAYLPNGKREDVCIECAMDERARIPQAFQEKAEQLTTTQSQLAKAITALEEISEGKGEYNRDPLVHATNTIESMKALASTTLAELRGGSSRSPAQAAGGSSPEIASTP
jgi:hypothetical protein